MGVMIRTLSSFVFPFFLSPCLLLPFPPFLHSSSTITMHEKKICNKDKGYPLNDAFLSFVLFGGKNKNLDQLGMKELIIRRMAYSPLSLEKRDLHG
ncbi:hypothetical protein BKA57DRAFT_460801 [Linnemannia elongata]|nr:hypothetical protein BKA57DRAFT_460801 [Linnemannia elongata]